jgi:hypothetical protein
MWIFCCGMYRAGSTLQYQLTARLVEEAGVGKRVEWAKPGQFLRVSKKMADYQGLKVFKCHICTDEIMAQFKKQNALGVYVFRDIREVVASTLRKKYREKKNEKFQGDFKKNLIERSLENYYKWTSLNNVLVSKYEEMILDLTGEAKRIARHIGVSLPGEKYLEISEDLSLDKQIQRIEAYKKTVPGTELSREKVINPHTLLHTDHITSGETDNWRHELTPEQTTLIEEKAGDWLKENGYTLSTQQQREQRGR